MTSPADEIWTPIERRGMPPPSGSSRGGTRTARPTRYSISVSSRAVDPLAAPIVLVPATSMDLESRVAQHAVEGWTNRRIIPRCELDLRNGEGLPPSLQRPCKSLKPSLSDSSILKAARRVLRVSLYYYACPHFASASAESGWNPTTRRPPAAPTRGHAFDVGHDPRAPAATWLG